MSYFEVLRQGSKFHSVDRKSDRSITIKPNDDGDDCLEGFQTVVSNAIAKAGDEYEVLPHETHMRGRTMYDFAAVWLK